MHTDVNLNVSHQSDDDRMTEKFICGDDPLLEKAKAALPIGEEFPVSFLQRRFRLGYARACKLYRSLQSLGQ